MELDKLGFRALGVVGGMKMGVYPGYSEMLVVCVNGNHLAGFIRQKTKTSHTGVDFQMRLRHAGSLGGEGVNALGVGGRANGKNHPQIQQFVNFSLVGGAAHHENGGLVKTRVPQGSGLLQVAHGEMVDPLGIQKLRQFYSADSIAVAF